MAAAAGVSAEQDPAYRSTRPLAWPENPLEASLGANPSIDREEWPARNDPAVLGPVAVETFDRFCLTHNGDLLSRQADAVD